LDIFFLGFTSKPQGPRVAIPNASSGFLTLGRDVFWELLVRDLAASLGSLMLDHARRRGDRRRNRLDGDDRADRRIANGAPPIEIDFDRPRFLSSMVMTTVLIVFGGTVGVLRRVASPHTLRSTFRCTRSSACSSSITATSSSAYEMRRIRRGDSRGSPVTAGSAPSADRKAWAWATHARGRKLITGHHHAQRLHLERRVHHLSGLVSAPDDLVQKHRKAFGPNRCSTT